MGLRTDVILVVGIALLAVPLYGLDDPIQTDSVTVEDRILSSINNIGTKVARESTLSDVKENTDSIKNSGTSTASNTAGIENDTGEIKSDTDSLEKVLGENGEAVGQFGRINTNQLRTQLDIASHYKFSPERLRLFLNGSREFVQYGDYDSSKFKDEPDTYNLRPGKADTMHIETAESATYVVGTSIQASFAFQVNRSLTGDECIRVGPYNGVDGWYMQHCGDDPNSSVVDLYEVRQGNPQLLKEAAVLPKPVSSWQRYEVVFNWYNVGNQVWTQTYTEDGKQVNKVFARTSLDGEKGPSNANLNAWFEVEAGNRSDLELEVGSMAFAIQSDADQLVRGKPQQVTATIPAGDNTWHPVYALKLENGTNVNARLNEFEVLRYTNNAPAEVLAVSFDSSKTDASNFSVPSYMHAQNSVVRDTFTVSEVANSTGQLVDPAGPGFKFGGYTLMSSSIVPSGNNFQSGASTATETTVKRQVLSSDVIVFLARSSTAGGDVTFDYVVEQDW